MPRYDEDLGEWVMEPGEVRMHFFAPVITVTTREMVVTGIECDWASSYTHSYSPGGVGEITDTEDDPSAEMACNFVDNKKVHLNWDRMIHPDPNEIRQAIAMLESLL